MNNNPYKYSHKAPIPVGAPGYPYPDRNGGPPGGETQTPLPPPYLPLSPPRATLPDYKLANELKGANGYLEGRVSVLVLAACVFDIQGEEIVYDFETLQRQKFTYTGESGFAFSLGSASETYYGGALWGFSEASNITQDYEGLFIGASLGGSAGLSVPILKALGLGEGGSVGMSLFSSPNLQVYGRAAYLTLGVSGGTGNLSGLLGILPDASAVATIYKPEGEKESYRGKELQMLRDLKSGDNSPLPFPLGLQMPFNNIYGDPLGFDIRDLGVAVGADTFTRKGIPVH